MDETRSALDASQKAGKPWLALDPPKDDGLINSYQLFYGALKEQADGLVKTQSIDAFLRCLRRRSGADFNDNYARFQQASESRAETGRQALMSNLGQLQHVFVLVPALLLVIAVLVWFAMSRW